MNRRTSLKLLVSSLIGYKIYPQLIVQESTLPQISLYGIPYHYTNASMGTWLGITRYVYPDKCILISSDKLSPAYGSLKEAFDKCENGNTVIIVGTNHGS